MKSSVGKWVKTVSVICKLLVDFRNAVFLYTLETAIFIVIIKVNQLIKIAWVILYLVVMNYEEI